jgi:hypothetical protein
MVDEIAAGRRKSHARRVCSPRGNKVSRAGIEFPEVAIIFIDVNFCSILFNFGGRWGNNKSGMSIIRSVTRPLNWFAAMLFIAGAAVCFYIAPADRGASKISDAELVEKDAAATPP